MTSALAGGGLPLKQKYGFHLSGLSAFRLARQPTPCLFEDKRRRLRDRNSFGLLGGDIARFDLGAQICAGDARVPYDAGFAQGQRIVEPQRRGRCCAEC